MRIVETLLAFAFIQLVSASEYEVKIHHEESTIQAGTIHFVAEVLHHGKPAKGQFKYLWSDNTLKAHHDIHNSNTNVDKWDVTYAADKGTLLGSYLVTVTVQKYIHGIYLPVTTSRAKFSITKYLHGRLGLTLEITDTRYVVTHKIIPSSPSLKYLEDNKAKISAYWYVDGVYYTVTNGFTVRLSYPKLYRSFAIQILVVVQFDAINLEETFTKDFDKIILYVDDAMDHAVINHATCNASFPNTQIRHNFEINKRTILGCFTRVFRAWDLSNYENIPLQHPLIISSSLDGLEEARERILNSQRRELEHIRNPEIRAIVLNRINNINKRIPIIANTNSYDYSNLETRMDNLKKSEELALDSLADPIVKAAVKQRINEVNEKIPFLTNSEIEYEFSNSLNSIHRRIDEAKKWQKFALDKVTNPVAKAALQNRIDNENKRLDMKSREVDSRISHSMDMIRKKIFDLKTSQHAALDDISNPLTKQTISETIKKQNQRIPSLLPYGDPNQVENVNKRIADLMDAENMALQRISDPEIKELVMSRIHKQNKKIPIMLKSANPIDDLSGVLEEIHKKFNDKIQKSSDIPLNGIKDATVKDIIANKIKEQNSILLSKSKEIDKNVTISLEEIRNRIKALKNSEQGIIENVSDPYVKEEILDQIDKENEKIPTLMLPFMMGTNFSFVLDKIRDKMSKLKFSEEIMSQNITNPWIQAMVLSKLDNVNTILNMKYNTLKENFTDILSAIIAKPTGFMAFKKIPILGKSIDSTSDLEYENPPASLAANFSNTLDLIDSKFKKFQDTREIVVENVTDPVIQAMVASKLDKVSSILNAKYKQLSDSFVNIIDIINAKIANATMGSTATSKRRKRAATTEIMDSSDENATLPSNFTAALDAFRSKMNELKDSAFILTKNITNPAIQALVLSKLDTVNSILSDKYQQLSDNFTNILNTISAKLTGGVGTKRVPILGKSLDEPVSPSLATNFSTALNALKTKINDFKNNQSIITQNITDPMTQSIVSSKFDLVNSILNSKYQQLNDNFTNILNMIEDPIASSRGGLFSRMKKTPILTKTLNSYPDDSLSLNSLAENYTLALDAIRTKMEDLKNVSAVISQNTTNPLKQSILSSKFDLVNSLLKVKYNQLVENYTNFLNTVNNPDESSFFMGTKKIPLLTKTLDSNPDESPALLPTSLSENFTLALDAVRARIDDLKNTAEVITQNITNPAIQAIVAAKLDRVNFILKTKYKQLSENFTNILDTINSNLIDAATNIQDSKKVPLLTKTLDASVIADAVRARMVGKRKPADVATKYILNPAVRDIVMNKIMEENKNLSTIADRIEANLTAAFDDFNQKAKDLEVLESLVVDNVEDPHAREIIKNQIDKENEKIPLLAYSKRRGDKKENEHKGSSSPKKNFRTHFPTLIRF